MSQWGTERWFSRGGTKIRTLPHINTPLWHPTTKAHLVDYLQLLEVIGDRKKAEQMFTQLRAYYVGKPYSLWVERGATEI